MKLHLMKPLTAVALGLVFHLPVRSEPATAGETLEKKAAAVAEKASELGVKVETAVKKGAKAAAQGIERGGQAVGRAVNKTARAVGLPVQEAASAASAASAPPASAP